MSTNGAVFPIRGNLFSSVSDAARVCFMGQTNFEVEDRLGAIRSAAGGGLESSVGQNSREDSEDLPQRGIM